MEASDPSCIFVNRQELSGSSQKSWIEEISKCNAFVNRSGHEEEEAAKQYWYDRKSGFWGWVGGPTQGIVSTSLPYVKKSCEGNWTSKWNIEEYTPTNVWVNGREVHPIDLDHFKRLRLPIEAIKPREPAAFWIIDEYGEVARETDQSRGTLIRKDTFNVITKVSEPKWIPYSELNEETSKTQKVKNLIKRIDGFFVYPITISCGDTIIESECKYGDFIEFNEYIRRRFNSLVFPLFPKYSKFKSSPSEETRRKDIELFLAKTLQRKPVQQCIEALMILHIHSRIDTVPRIFLHKKGFEQPLLSLSDEERTMIAGLLSYVCRDWDIDLNPLYINLLRILQLPPSASHEYLRVRQEIRFPLDILQTLPPDFKWDVIWKFLQETIRFGNLDARVHLSIEECAYYMKLPLHELLELEGKCAGFLQRKLTEMETKKLSSSNKGKIIAGGVVGGAILLVCGIIATPLLIPVFLSGTALVAATLPASLGISSAVIMSGSLVALVMSPTLPLVFGAAGAGLGALKVNAITKGINDFGFINIPKSLTEAEKQDVIDSDAIMENTFTIDMESQDVILTEKGKLMDDPELEKKELERLKEIKATTTPDIAGETSNDVKNPGESVPLVEGKKNKSMGDLFWGGSKVEDNQEEAEKAEESNTGMRVCICIQGWLWKESEYTTMWFPVREADPSSELYALRWETPALLKLGSCLVKTVTTMAASKAAKFWLVMMSSIAAAFFAALVLPLAVLLVAGAIDNSWTIVHTRAKKVGKLLAETLVERVHGNRPVSLISVSIGSQVLFSCLQHLKTLEMQGKDVRGLIENVYFLGSACPSEPKFWASFRSIVIGRLVNGYCRSDWILGLIHRTAGMTYSPAGLQAIEQEGVENIDLTDTISGHLQYKKKLPDVLKILQVGRSINVSDWIPEPKPEEENE